MGVVLKADKERMFWLNHFIRLDHDYLNKVTEQMPVAIDHVNQVFEAMQVLSGTTCDAWWVWLSRAVRWVVSAIDRILITQAKIADLKRRIVQVDAVIVAIQRGLPVQGVDLAMGQYLISWANLCIARRNRQMTDKDFYFSCGRLRDWLAVELVVRAERVA